MSTQVAVVKTLEAVYPNIAPYSPRESFPEYPFEDNLSTEPNFIYPAVRELFIELEYDKDNFGKPNWNPLGHLIKPGMTVVIKPNFVRSRHFENKDPYSMITHPSVLRAITDYCWISLNGEGKIIVADAPQYDGNWEELLNLTKLDKVKAFYDRHRKNSFDVYDLRNYWSEKRHFPSMLIDLEGDPKGSLRINLGEESVVKDVPDSNRLYGAVYHRQETVENHKGNNQIYEISNTVMDADVFISVPKLKTHKKVGVTMNIKGLVGACTNKNLIVHYSLGSKNEGGDQYPPNHFTPMEERLIKIERWMYDSFLAKRSAPLEYVHRTIYWLHGTFIKPLGIGVEKKKRLLDVGNWYGNDSAWRMCVDLIKLIMFADKKGKLHKTPQRVLFTIIDGIIGGENKGPLEPDPNYSAVLIASENFLSADIVGCRLMGFDPLKIKTFTYLLSDERWNYGVRHLSDIEIKSTNDELRNCLDDRKSKFFNYKPYPGWVNHIEI
jgi:uncharacterized protein (DUF362 family)